MPVSVSPSDEIMELRAALSERDLTISECRSTITVLQEKIAWLTQKLFGSGKSEKLDVAQMRLQLEELTRQLESLPTKQVSYERRPVAGKHEIAAERFKDLAVEETVVIEPPEVLADPGSYEQISAEETFEVDIHPPKLFKRRFVRPKYRHRDDRSLPPLVAAAPARPINSGYASAGLIAWVLLNKYVGHQPLYRQEKISVMWGAFISRKTMADWVAAAALWLQPVYECMRRQLLAGSYIQADETPVRYCDRDHHKGKAEQGWLWAISRPGGDVVFDWRLSRRHGELTSLLDGYTGLLQSDAYGAYGQYAEQKGAIQLGCMAHARRKFYEALQSDSRPCTVVLKLMAKLYAREKEYRQENLSHEQRQQRRKAEQRHTLQWLRRTINYCLRTALPKSALGKAAAYATANWQPLTRYIKHGIANIDNNLMENAIRPSALGKKNFLFIGHPEAGQRSAIIYSIVVSCQRHGIDPFAYIKDLLMRLPTMNSSQQIADLTPQNWAKAQQQNP